MTASDASKEAARNAAETTRTTLNSLAGGLSNLMSFNSALLEAYSEAGRAYVKQMSALGEELTAFTNRRLKEQAEQRETLSKCKDWNEALRTQQDFLQVSSKTYLDETGRLFKLLGEATFAGVNPFVEKLDSLPQQLAPTKSPLTPASVNPASPASSKAA